MHNPWLTAVYRVLRQSSRCIVAEHCYLARLPLTYGDRFVYASQNNETELKRTLLEEHPLKIELMNEVEGIERLSVERSAATIAVSQDDAESLVQGKRTAGPVIVVRNGSTAPATGGDVECAKEDFHPRIGDRAVLFLGSAHIPNIESAHFILNDLAPKCPDVEFHLLGSICSSISNPPSNVYLWGVVDEVIKSAVMQSCKLALNPMTSGSGSNVKLADYIANGLFVISTEFGIRGYPSAIQEHVSLVPLDGFSSAIRTALENDGNFSHEAVLSRRKLFERKLMMRRIAQRFVETLRGLEKIKLRVLFVTYRYTYPTLGGAEAHIEKFIRALGESGEFDVDVVAPEISGIQNYLRFSETYSFDNTLAAPVDIPNVRFARFPVEPPSPQMIRSQLQRAWFAQPRFEHALDEVLRESYSEHGHTWGWGPPGIDGERTGRWSYVECGLFVHKASKVSLEGYAPKLMVATIYNADQIICGPNKLWGEFKLSFQAEAGDIRLSISTPSITSDIFPLEDVCPLGALISKVEIDGQPLDILSHTLIQKKILLLSAEKTIRLLDQASLKSRTALGIRLTDGRGPWSDSLERFITDHVADYNLLITHNNVFRPASVAIDEAKKHGIPSILIPHAHLDDDFYHFPDWMESCRNASLVLAAPRVACDFLAEKGCKVEYLTAGYDSTEQFTSHDENAFQRIYSSARPFVLVLGRKAIAKAYQQIIDACERLNQEGCDLQIVLIGPDDDGIPVDSPNAVYLGRQPRNVVRGALLTCMALCTMSTSESFGIVLLEAWQAGKPVIANKHCAAFGDFAVHGYNSLLVDYEDLAEAMRSLLLNQELRELLAKNGRKSVAIFDWQSITNQFLAYCKEIVCQEVNVSQGSAKVFSNTLLLEALCTQKSSQLHEYLEKS
jgi:glycosyltransferase involved in cell wall biosynthesis